MNSSWENIGNAKNIKIKPRKHWNMPYSAYRASDWCLYVKEQYPLVFGVKCDQYDRGGLFGPHSNILKRDIFPLVFSELGWTAEDFANYIKIDMERMRQRGEKFSIALLKTDFSKNMIKAHNKALEDKRSKSVFEQEVYFPFHILDYEEDIDLYDILSENLDEPLKMFYWYGLPNCHKALQIYKDISFDESKEIVKTEMEKILRKYKNRKDIISPIIHGIAKSSIEWGPYIWKKKLLEKKEFIVLDWYEYLRPVWEYFEVTSQDYWIGADKLYYRKVLKHVQGLFELTVNPENENKEQ